MAWWHRLLRRGEAEAELDEEIRFHLEQEAQLRTERGESPEDAAIQARRDFGNVLLVKDATRDVWGQTLARDFGRDLAYAVRLLRRSPAFTAVAVLSLALGIGANTAIFSLADAVIFRKLPVHDPERLVQVREVHDRGTGLVNSYPLYRDIRDGNQVLTSTVASGAFAWPEPITLKMPEQPPRDVHARLTVVTGNYFLTLGVEPVAGRALTPDDDRAPGAHPVAVVSHRFWRRTLDADAAAALRTTFTHNGVAYQVIGIAPAGFTGISSNDDPEIWLPLMMAGAVLQNPGMFEARGSSSLYVFGRLKPGVTAAAASADIARVFADVQRIHPDSPRSTGEVLSMARGVQRLRERFERPLLVLLGMVGLLLLLACANLAALLLARAASRRHEIAVRLSLGASPSRLVRQFLAESVLIAALGGAAGLLASALAASALIDLVTTWERRLPIAFTLDSRILIFTAAISLATAVLFGLFPALQANRTPPGQATKSGTRTPSRLAGGRLLIATQMALALFLLVAAGLFIRSLGNLQHLDTGFARDHVLVVMIDPRAAYGKEPERYLDMYRNLPERVARLPGVRSASFADGTFFGSSASRGNIAYEGHSQPVPRSDYPYKLRITPGFLDTMQVSVLTGRAFTNRDDRDGRKVVIVSQSVAEQYYAGQNAVGRRLCFSDTFDPGCALEIVGVVNDVRYNNLRQASPFTVYVPIEQERRVRGDLQVRTLVDPRALAGPVQAEIRRFNPELRVVATTTLEQILDDSIAQDRLLATLSAAFALLAVLLAAVGLYGITSYDVQRRTNEIGVRMALGASATDVRWMVLREVLSLIIAGAVVGIAAALAASGVVRTLLFGLPATDPLTVAGATLALSLVAAVAGYLPARRATRIDPIAALRTE